MSDFVHDYLRARYPGASEEFLQARMQRVAKLAKHSGKTCRRCGVHKSFSEFGRDSASPDGHMARCRVCRR